VTGGWLWLDELPGSLGMGKDVLHLAKIKINAGLRQFRGSALASYQNSETSMYYQSHLD
jgi:hypothetical protein